MGRKAHNNERPIMREVLFSSLKVEIQKIWKEKSRAQIIAPTSSSEKKLLGSSDRRSFLFLFLLQHRFDSHIQSIRFSSLILVTLIEFGFWTIVSCLNFGWTQIRRSCISLLLLDRFDSHIRGICFSSLYLVIVYLLIGLDLEQFLKVFEVPMCLDSG